MSFRTKKNNATRIQTKLSIELNPMISMRAVITYQTVVTERKDNWSICWQG